MCFSQWPTWFLKSLLDSDLYQVLLEEHKLTLLRTGILLFRAAKNLGHKYMCYPEALSVFLFLIPPEKQICRRKVQLFSNPLAARKASGLVRRLASLKGETHDRIPVQKEQYCRRWKQGQASKDEHRNTMQARGDSIRKAKAQMEFSLVGVVKGNNTSFYHNISGKKLDKENVGLWQTGEAESKHHKAEVLHCLFCLGHRPHGLLIGPCA